MSRISPVIFALLVICTTASSFARSPIPEEGVFSEASLSSSYAAMLETAEPAADGTRIVARITSNVDGPVLERSPAQLGIIAIAPRGRVQAVVAHMEISTPDDPSHIRNISLNTGDPNPVILGKPGIWRDLRVVDISLQPVISVGNETVVIHRITFTVTTGPEPGINEKTRPETPISPTWDAVYRQHILNYDSLNITSLERGTGKRYIVISRSYWDSVIPEFVQWKNQQGYGVDLVTLEDLGYSNPSTNDAMNAIKDYINDAYSNWTETPEFVLLVGDISNSGIDGAIWTQKFYNYFYSQGYMFHDQWYGFLEGNDLFADIMVGRFPDVQTARMAYQLGKSIRYEKDPHLEGTWQRRTIMTLDSSISETINTKNTVSDNLSDWGMTSVEYFGYPYNVIPAMNSGFTFYNYRGDYCGSTSWGSTFDSGDVAYVNNQNKIGVFTILSCSSAMFDFTITTAEELLRLGHTNPENPRGALAFVGSQAYTAYQYNNPLDKGFYYAWTDTGVSMLGQAFISGKIYAWTHMPGGFDPNRRDCMMKEYTILGDPSVRLWTNVPSEMTVDISPHIIPIGQSSDISVTVTSPTSFPIVNALVCAWRDDDVFMYGYTDGSGTSQLSVDPGTEGEISLTITAYNRQPYFGTITAVSDPIPQSPGFVSATPTRTGDIILSWNPVNLDITGSPITIDHYEVFRNAEPFFTLEGMTPLSSITATEYTDTDVVGDPETNFTYRIIAVSSEDVPSAASDAVGEFDYPLTQ